MPTTEECGLELAKAAAEGAGKESVNKLADAIGGIFPFWGLKKKAVSTYISEIENSNLSPEAKMMAIANAKKTYKQMKNQSSIAQIAKEAASAGTNFSATSGVDDEWLERFMDSAKFVSDEQVQLLWGNILAKEFEQPGCTPPSIIRILTEITPTYAKAFQTLCNLAVSIVITNPDGNLSSFKKEIILPSKYDYLAQYNLTYAVLSELQMLGLIQYETLGFILTLDATKKPKLHLVYGKNVATILQYPDKRFPCGCVRLTNAGQTIARFTKEQNINGHFDAVVEYLKSNKVQFAEVPEIQVK